MNIDYELWTDFKTDILSKGFPYNHQTVRNQDSSIAGYLVFVVDRTVVWQCMVNTTDGILDFETNYKSNSNRNTTYNVNGTPQSVSTVMSTPNGSTWVKQTTHAGWSARTYHSTVVMPDGTIILMGGYETGNNKNDIWKSVDNGITWTQVTASAAWEARCGHTSVVAHDGSIILMGGYGSSGNLSDVWRSTDNGSTWTQKTAAAGWEGRYYFSSAAMPDGSIIILGGSGVSTILANDVWRSTDNGSTWTQMSAAAEWSEREFLSSVSLLDGSIVMMGGSDLYGSMKNDVWRSTDGGTTWTNLTENAWWTPRYSHSSVSTPGGIIVMMGGFDVNGAKNDVWKSTDGGTTWAQMTTNAGWGVRSGHTSVMLPDGGIVMMGGIDIAYVPMNDVWYSVNTQVVQISGQSVFVYISGGSVVTSISGQIVTTSVSGNTVSIQPNAQFASASGYCATSSDAVTLTFVGNRPFTYEGAVVKSTTTMWSANLVLYHTAIVNIAGEASTISSFFTNQTISSTTRFVSGYPLTIFASGDTHIIKFVNTSGGYTTSGRTLSMRAAYKML